MVIFSFHILKKWFKTISIQVVFLGNSDSIFIYLFITISYPPKKCGVYFPLLPDYTHKSFFCQLTLTTWPDCHWINFKIFM